MSSPACFCFVMVEYEPCSFVFFNPSGVRSCYLTPYVFYLNVRSIFFSLLSLHSKVQTFKVRLFAPFLLISSFLITIVHICTYLGSRMLCCGFLILKQTIELINVKRITTIYLITIHHYCNYFRFFI
jgi:hypothetical protein